MWLFTRYGFFSVTVSNQDRTKIQIRARAKQDLERLLNFAEKYGLRLSVKNGGVIETPKADYRYRLIIRRDKWPTLAHALAGDVDYSNFKNEINDPERHRLYEEVWRTMLQLQQRGGFVNLDDDFSDRTYYDFLGDDNLPGLPAELNDEDDDPSDPYYDPDRYKFGSDRDDEKDWD